MRCDPMQNKIRYVARLALGAMVWTAALHIFPAMAGPPPAARKPRPMLRLDYYVAGRWERLPDYDAAALQTLDVAIFFVPLVPDAAGHLAPGATFAPALAHLKLHKNAGTRIWLGLGSLTPVTRNAPALTTLIAELQALCDQHGFGGIDLDWEDAVRPEDYGRVVAQIYAACHPAGRLLAVSVGPDGGYAAKVRAAGAAVDYVNVQAYYSTMNGFTVPQLQARMEAFTRSAGVPPEKICLGLPLYGAAAVNKSTGGKEWSLGYRALLGAGAAAEQNAWTDPARHLTYYYSGLTLIKDKVDYAQRAGFGGIFTWEMTMDAPYAGTQSLLRTIDGAMGLTPGHGLKTLPENR